jgi:hypothetical protein
MCGARATGFWFGSFEQLQKRCTDFVASHPFHDETVNGWGTEVFVEKKIGGTGR